MQKVAFNNKKKTVGMLVKESQSGDAPKRQFSMKTNKRLYKSGNQPQINHRNWSLLLSLTCVGISTLRAYMCAGRPAPLPPPPPWVGCNAHRPPCGMWGAFGCLSGSAMQKCRNVNQIIGIICLKLPPPAPCGMWCGFRVVCMHRSMHAGMQIDCWKMMPQGY